MSSKILFVRRTPKEVEVFGGVVYIDIDGKNIGKLGIIDNVIEIEQGKHKIKMYKSHTYDTYIGFAEVEIDIRDGEDLLIKYASPMLVNQPGNIIISDYHSPQEVQEYVQKREKQITADHTIDEQKKRDLDEKSRNGIMIFIILMIVIAIIYAISISSIYSDY